MIRLLNLILCSLMLLSCNTTATAQSQEVPIEAAFAYLPIFTLPVMNGEPGQMYGSAHDKPMLIEFYFNSCPACNQNAPAVKEMSNLFNNDRTHVVEFGYDCRQSDYDAWNRRHSPTAFLVNGCNSDVLDALNVSAYPTTVIVDKDHNLVKRYVGTWNARTKAEIKATMERLSQ